MDQYYYDRSQDRILKREEGKMLYESLSKSHMVWLPSYLSHPKLVDRYFSEQNFEKIDIKQVLSLIQKWKSNV